MASRRVAVNVKQVLPTPGKKPNQTPAQKKRKTPVFVYLFPVLPIIFMVLMLGKSPESTGDQSFMVPPDVKQIQRANPEIATVNADFSTITRNEAVVPIVKEEKYSNSKLKIIKQNDNLILSPNTVVTGYFTVKSKVAKEEYLNWMTNMLSLQDAMVIFTTPDLVEMMQGFRAHARNRTVIIAMDLNDVEIVEKFAENSEFWPKQLDQDPEKRVHRSFELFWIWLSKSYFVTTAINLNFFESDVYMWSDIGCFRNKRYNGKEMILQRDRIPTDRILQMAHHRPKPPPYIWWNDKYTQTPLFYHSGSQMVGYKNTWLEFHTEFLKTIDGFVQRNMFIGEDQTVLQSTCLRIPRLCAYVPFRQVKDNHYFGLRYVMSTPGVTYEYWYPPTSGIVTEKDEVQDKSLLQPMAPPPRPGRETFRAA
eukprot:CAMPEP_0194217296 /NCGR_PEP_ID=MMETSP0156-20130528/20939_1 /TAXON_ID=33649 /ORGANISM="Thalassionema nitzschioides, Strain L26-B" /LENGTH=420 /DNA_ID=CAMNT_0038946309 /DNA_START=77 /DNA_END=1339 /DNA_ORIENTATION=-